MENYEDIFKKICRVCLKIIKYDKMEPLIDNTDPSGLSCFGKAIPMFTSVAYTNDNKLPTNVCQMCIYLLKQAIKLKFTCELSEKLLKNVVEESMKNNSSITKVRENICQFVMYKHCFPANVLNYKKNKYCPISKTSRSNIPAVINIVNSQENQQISDKQGESKTDNLLQECDNDLTDNHDDYSNNTQPTVKLTSNITNTRKITIANRSKEQLIDELRDLIDKKRRKKVERKKYTKQRDIPCQVCNKVLANQATYDQHMQRHNICRYVCDKCGKGFPILTELNIHQISRHGIGPYLKCNECSYKAPTKLKLKEHIRLHTGERPYTCDKCGLTFRRQAIWRNHQVFHTEKTVQCKICPQKFYRQGCMLAHMNNVHERKYIFICSICDVTYAKRESVRQHMVLKHGIKRELQGKIKRIDKTQLCFTDK